MIDLGVRLQVLLGPKLPLPAPYEVVDALRSVEVRNSDREQDGFQMELTLGKGTLGDYGLLQGGLLDPPSRVILIAIFNVVPEVLIDGIITDHQVVPGNRPGESVLRVSGSDVSVMMDLEEKNATFPNQPDSLIVTRILAGYAQYGLLPAVTPTADFPIALQRVPSQRSTDLEFIRKMAKRNGFVFYVEPTPVPGVNKAYWGPEVRVGLPQAPLTLNMIGQTNVDAPVHFRFDALGPATEDVTILEGNTGIPISIPFPGLTIPLSARPARSLRKRLSCDAAKLNPAQAAARGLAASTEGADAVDVTGEVDAVRYGRLLRARRLVSVRGVGLSYGGFYYVRQVTHRLRRGEYKQSFRLVREGRLTLTPLVNPT